MGTLLLQLQLAVAQMSLLVISSQIAPQIAYAATQVPKNDSTPQILRNIALCESGDNQFNQDGSVLRGKVNSDDIGRFQVNLKYHDANAKKMGLDLMSLEGNTEYAEYLFRKNGTKDWLASEKCWNK